MSVRIYALAKQLQVESKILVDICKRLRPEDKVSPLASLSDEEVELVKKELEKGISAPKSARDYLENVGSIPTPQPKPIVSLQTGKIPVLKPIRPAVDPLKNASGNQEKTPPADLKSISEETNSNAPQNEEKAASETKTVPILASEEKKSVDTPGTIASDNADLLSPLSELKKKVPVLPAKKVPKLSEKVSPTTEIDEASSSEDSSAGLNSEMLGISLPPQTGAINASLEEGTRKNTDSTETAQQEPVSPTTENQPLAKTVPVKGTVPNAPSVPKTPSIPKVPSVPKAGSTSKAGATPVSRTSSETAKSDQKHRTSPLRPQQDDSRRNHGSAPLSRHRQRIEDVPPNQRRIGSTLASMEEAARQAALAEMKAAPLITEMPKDRIVDLNAVSKKKPKEDYAEKSGKGHHEQKGHTTVRLAPLPTNTVPVKATKTQKEPAPQKPAARFGTPEELREAMAKGITPLSSHIKAGRDKREKRDNTAPQKSTPSQSRIIDMGSEKDTSKRERDGKGKKKYAQTEVYMSGDDDSMVKKGSGKKTKLRPDPDSSESRWRGPKSRSFIEDDSTHEYRPSGRISRGSKNKGLVSTVPRKGDCVIEMPCTVKQFAESTGLSVAFIIKKMLEFGYILTINQSLDHETLGFMVEAFELKAVIKKERSLEEIFVDTAFDQEDPPESLKPRPPIVTFLGHVDHGKTSLLDRIMHMNVVSGEKGGITQHIRTYRVKKEKGEITFVDTPGHEAFTEMRARGANCTDIAVLVVAADDGVMPQTEEAISHIKAAGVPIVVAMNKMDLPGANREKVISELANADVMPSEWGGDVEVVETSATTGKGIDELLDTLLMIAELKELKANPNRPANGVALEAAMLPGRGVVCKILVQTGTLRPGDIVLCGTAYGKVKAMFDPLDEKKHLKAAGPSTPVNLLGLNTVPSAGSKFVVLDDISVARQIATEREQLVHSNELADDQSHITLENLFDRINSAKTQQTLNVIIRADVRGSIEAIRKEISKLEHPEVKIKILQASVGGITEADVHLADASDAIIVGFSVVPDEGARSLAENKKVQIRRYDIIYKLTEDLRAAMEGMLKPIEQVKELGRALVKQVFSISRIGTIAGCRVISGTIERDCRVRVIRDSRVIGEYILDTLKREKDDAKEVREGYECGIKLRNFNDIKEGDVLEGYKIEEIARSL